MHKLSFTLEDEAAELLDGLNAMADADVLEIAEDGRPVMVRRGSAMRLTVSDEGTAIQYVERAQFFRLLSYLLDDGAAAEVREAPAFKRVGAMLDASRNAVPNMGSVKCMLRLMALMGMNVLMLYTEDTYEVPEMPYFGTMRGRYTQSELRAIDDYADALGIEVVPCIQTLGHLEKVLRWPAFAPMQDVKGVLTVGETATRDFLKTILQAASAPFRSKRIHVGMDEAWGIGSGRYLQKYGYHELKEIMREHLRTVTELCGELGLDMMLWSDMCLRPLSPTEDYYDVTTPVTKVPPELAATVPANATLVYWDYYHTDEHTYDVLLSRHESFHVPVIFAGGAWTWNGLTPAMGAAFAVTMPALNACRRHKVDEVICTCWADNGAETSVFTALPVFQLYAESCYRGDVTQEQVFRRFDMCCNAHAEDWWRLRLLDETPDVKPGNTDFHSPSKYLLYQDALCGLFDCHVPDHADMWYGKLAEAIQASVPRNPAWSSLFAHYAALADALSIKAELGKRITAAYVRGDKAAVTTLLPDIDKAAAKIAIVRETFRTLWLADNKPFGFECVDIRVSGVIARLQSARLRLESWLNGEVDTLLELDEPRLPFREGKKTLNCNYWEQIVSACPIAGV